MIKYILTLWLILMPSIAYATIPTTILGTAYSDGIWYPSNSTYINAGNKGGIAYIFNLPEDYYLDSIEAFISGMPLPTPEPGYLNYSLYTTVNKDNLILPSNTSIYTSDTFNILVDGEVRGYVSTFPTPLTLTKGNYALGMNGRTLDNPAGLHAAGYNLQGRSFSEIHNPEPLTALTLFTGMACLAGIKRRLKQN